MLANVAASIATFGPSVVKDFSGNVFKSLNNNTVKFGNIYSPVNAFPEYEAKKVGKLLRCQMMVFIDCCAL